MAELPLVALMPFGYVKFCGNGKLPAYEDEYAVRKKTVMMTSLFIVRLIYPQTRFLSLKYIYTIKLSPFLYVKPGLNRTNI